MNVTKIKQELDKIGKIPRFVSITYRSKETGELAQYTINIGVSYENVLLKSLDQINEKLPELTGVEKQAGEELRDSIQNSLIRLKTGQKNDDYTKKGIYHHVTKGLQVNLNDGSFELTGVVRSKKVIEEGQRKSRKSSDKTIAKNKLKKDLPWGNYRTFALDAETAQSMRINKGTLEFGKSWK